MVADDRKSQSVGQLLLKHCITTSCSTLGFRSKRKGFSLLLCLGDAHSGANCATANDRKLNQILLTVRFGCAGSVATQPADNCGGVSYGVIRQDFVKSLRCFYFVREGNPCA